MVLELFASDSLVGDVLSPSLLLAHRSYSISKPRRLLLADISTTARQVEEHSASLQITAAPLDVCRFFFRVLDLDIRYRLYLSPA